MWLVETLNSTYSVEAIGSHFKVTKVDGIASEYYLDKGQSRLHTMVAFEVGKRAHFGSIQTTTVKSVKEAR